MAAHLLRPSSSELEEQALVSRRLITTSGDALRQEVRGQDDDKSTEHCELGNLQIACVAAIAQLQGRLEAVERQVEDQMKALKTQVMTRLMEDQQFASGSMTCEPLIGKELDVLAKRVNKMHDKAETRSAEMSQRVLALEIQCNTLEKRLRDTDHSAQLAIATASSPVDDLSNRQERILAMFESSGPNANPKHEEIVNALSRQHDMVGAFSLESQVTTLGSLYSGAAVLDNRAPVAMVVKDERSMSFESQVTTIMETGLVGTTVMQEAPVLLGTTQIIQVAPPQFSDPTGADHSFASAASASGCDPSSLNPKAARVLSPRPLQRTTASEVSVVRSHSPLPPSRDGGRFIKGNPSSMEEDRGLIPAAGYRHPSPNQAVECSIVRVASPVQRARTGPQPTREAKSKPSAPDDPSGNSSSTPAAGVRQTSPTQDVSDAQPTAIEAPTHIRSVPLMRQSSPMLTSSATRTPSNSVAVTRQVSAGSAVAPTAGSFQPAAPSRSSPTPAQIQTSSGMSTPQRPPGASSGAIGPGRDAKGRAGDLHQPGARTSFRTLQNVAGARSGTPRGSKAANRQMLGPGSSTAASTPAIGKGAAMSQANRGRFFPAASTPFGTPAATTQSGVVKSPKLNYRMAPAPPSDEDVSDRGTPEKKKTKGPIVAL